MEYKAESNEQTRKTNKNSYTQTIVWWLPERKGRDLVKGKVSQIYGNGRWFDFGWWAYNAIYRNVSQKCTHETYIILLTNVTPINLIQNKNKWNKSLVFFQSINLILGNLFNRYMNKCVNQYPFTIIHLSIDSSSKRCWSIEMAFNRWLF